VRKQIRRILCENKSGFQVNPPLVAIPDKHLHRYSILRGGAPHRIPNEIIKVGCHAPGQSRNTLNRTRTSSLCGGRHRLGNHFLGDSLGLKRRCTAFSTKRADAFATDVPNPSGQALPGGEHRTLSFCLSAFGGIRIPPTSDRWSPGFRSLDSGAIPLNRLAQRLLEGQRRIGSPPDRRDPSRIRR
jgi:hypothetical protein